MSPVPAPSDLPVELRTEALESLLASEGLVDLVAVEERAGVLACRPAGHDHDHEHGH